MADFPTIPQPPDWDKMRTIIQSFSPVRPLDQNGIDVYGELPVMQRAYAKTLNGTAFKGTGEAGYSIFKSDPGVGRTGFSYGSDLHMGIPVNKDTIAVVHTHPRGGEPTPSPLDMKMKFPNYVFSGNQLYVTDPKTGKYYKYDIDKWNLSPKDKASLQELLERVLVLGMFRALSKDGSNHASKNG